MISNWLKKAVFLLHKSIFFLLPRPPVQRLLLCVPIVFLVTEAWSQSIHFDNSAQMVGKVFNDRFSQAPCSGVMIGPKIALTNLHCLGNRNGFDTNPYFKTDLGKRSEIVDIVYPDMPLSIAEIWKKKDAYVKDYAFVVLKDVLPPPYAEMDLEFNISETTHLVSYGYPNLQYKKHLMFSSPLKPWYDHPNFNRYHPAYLVLKGMSVAGMSGGGLFERRGPNKQLVLIGVNKGGGIDDTGAPGASGLLLSQLPQFKELYKLAKDKSKNY